MNKIKTVVLPFDEALERASVQNFNKDVRKGKVIKSKWKDLKDQYLGHARVLLIRDGENTKPESPDREHFVLKPSSC